MRKQRIFPLLLAGLVLLAAGCEEAQEMETPERPEQAQARQMERLAIEISKSDLPAEKLLEAAARLPDAIEDALAEQGVSVGEVTMTIGSSPSATVSALESRDIDLAFLPAASLAEEAGPDAEVLLVSGPLFWDQGEDLAAWNQEPAEAPLKAGYRALICAAPTAYGRNLAAREELTWTEVERARWGVLEEDSIPGYRAVNLWLADHFGGNTISDLPDVTVYNSFEELLLAASAGEIDLLPMDEGERIDFATAWTLPVRETDSQMGLPGQGHEGEIWEELPAVGLTEWFYSAVAAVAPELNDEAFATAMGETLRVLCHAADTPEEIRRLSTEVFEQDQRLRYSPAPEGALDAERRLLELEKGA